MAGNNSIEARLKILPDTKAAASAVQSLTGDVRKLATATAEANKRFGFDSDFGRFRRQGAGGEGIKGPGKSTDFKDAYNKFADDASKEAGNSLKSLAVKAAAVVAAFAAVSKAVGAGAIAYYEGKSKIGIADATLSNTPVLGAAYGAMKGAASSTIYAKSLAYANLEEKYSSYRESVNNVFTGIDVLKGGIASQNTLAGNRVGTSQAEGPNRMANRALYGERFEEAFNQNEAERNKAKRELEIAKKNVSSTYDDLAKEQRISKGFKGEVESARKEVKTAANGAEEMAARSRLSTAENELARQLESEKAASERHAKASLDVVAKLQDSLAAETGLIQAKRDRAKTLLDETKSGAASFLTGTAEDKYMLAASLRQLKEGGTESLAPEQLQQLLGNSLTGEYAKREILKGAGNDPLLNSILQDTGRGSIADQEKKLAELNAELDVKIKLDQEQIEEAIRKALEENGITAEDIAVRIGDRAVREIDNKLNAGQLGQGLGVR